MSVFGGDNWAREAQQRKRRVEDVVADGLDASSYKKLSNGKFACLLCSHSPVLDSPLMLSMHCKGSRHRAAESRLKERELARQNEMNKRIALSDSSGGTAKSRTCNQKFESGSKPLIEQVLRAASGIFTHRDSPEELKSRDLESNVVAQQHLDYQERRERELKFTAAGWKRDCYGKWYKDENVEFDSDEEDPNICLG
ncbi:uncharacterized protein LOC107411215 isoform X3 [Ziziphus jujuba]|uniref:Sodium channel modifier 1 n=1 Tax=Ziziphus jujuba TaxID=326968 RepID=A0A6P3ZHI9_ZIZJJ|nr:uncharacterized protein LOC107411215 isoform X3 [Ziziphus jujuba]